MGNMHLKEKEPDGTVYIKTEVSYRVQVCYLLSSAACCVIRVAVGPSSVVRGSLSSRQGASYGCGWRNGLQYGRQLRTHCISCRGQRTRGGPPAWCLGEVLTAPHSKINCDATKHFGRFRAWLLGKESAP